jgi:5,10-methylenetetrahydromethanopterin reductase
MIEIGIVNEPSAGFTAPNAKRIEDMGFEYLLTPDTQNLSADPYGQLSLAAAATKTLKIGTGVTNPITRDVAVTASAFATLQIESHGRAICGIGRGDSSAAHIGKKQATGEQLSFYANAIRTYIAGGEVNRDGTPSKMRWIKPGEVSPVPIDIACTGPKTIELAADIGDRVSFAVGSSPERIAWAMDIFNARMAVNGRERSDVRVGAYINLVCDNDEQKAVNLARTVAGLVSHFSGMKAAPTEHLPVQIKGIAEKLKSQYDMAHHAQEEGSHLQMLDDDFVRWMAICGGPDFCMERVSTIIDMGLQHIYLLGGSPYAEPHGKRITGVVDMSELFAREVIPQLRKSYADL